MGPSRKLNHDELKALLWQKDEQIAALERQLEACSARASATHVRLLKAVDVLDSLRAQHALEISVVEQEKIKLTHDADQWRTISKALEVEKDEMKEVVEDLIEKIQISNEWASWPCSRMHIAKPAEPPYIPATALESTTKSPSDDLLAYASAIIARLRSELEFERREHRKTVEEANHRIEELEAQVAIRETELETQSFTRTKDMGVLVYDDTVTFFVVEFKDKTLWLDWEPVAVPLPDGRRTPCVPLAPGSTGNAPSALRASSIARFRSSSSFATCPLNSSSIWATNADRRVEIAKHEAAAIAKGNTETAALGVLLLPGGVFYIVKAGFES
ncbi:hypothetical protein EDC04DRAFT_2890565 [Pisolithus marmoratus]|nr:hypothetical protein EDC04DRAFT_2890565 [Pisolithus marmoratus]